VRYFSCNDNHGLYVKAGQIESVVGDAQTNLPRSASNQSIKSQPASTGMIPAPATAGVPTKTTAVTPKQTGLRAPTANTSIRPSGIK
jgi:hypothetical protein